MTRVFARPGRRGLIPGIALALCAAVLLLLGIPGADGAYVAKVTNGNNTVSTFINCKWAITGTPPGAAYFGYPLGESSGNTAADVSGNNRPGTYSTLGVTYGVAGPCPRDGTTAITLDGISGSVAGPTTAVVGPNTFTIAIWFKTTTAGGKLIGFGDVRNLLTSANYDRHLYIDSTGRLEFGVYPNAVKTISSPNTVTDGAWHDAVATLSSAGMMLYLDGTLVASQASVTTAQSFTGYWRIGWDNLNGWTNAPGNFFFRGSLAYASEYSYALTAAQVADHYRAGI